MFFHHLAASSLGLVYRITLPDPLLPLRYPLTYQECPYLLPKVYRQHSFQCASCQCCVEGAGRHNREAELSPTYVSTYAAHHIPQTTFYIGHEPIYLLTNFDTSHRCRWAVCHYDTFRKVLDV
jgi:hypothetical protein